MKRPILIICIFVSHVGAVLAQSKSEIKEVDLDVLRAPDSPAGNLLDISNEQINRPTDPTAFMTLIKQSSSDFSSIPTEFAVDVAPWLLFSPEKMTLESWRGKYDAQSDTYKDDPWNNFKNTLVVSVGTRFLDSLELDNLSNVRRVSGGVKFSILRGKSLDKELEENLLKLKEYRKSYSTLFDKKYNELLSASKEYAQITDSIASIKTQMAAGGTEEQKIKLKNMLVAKLQELANVESELSEQASQSANASAEDAKTIVENLKWNHTGFKLDFAGGIVYDFANNNFDNGSFSKAGAWLTGGWDTNSRFSFFFLARYMINPNLTYLDDSDTPNEKNVNNFDFGGKLSYGSSDQKFNGGFEFIYRNYDEKEVEDGLRGTLNLSYDIGNNKQIGVAFGRDFDGTISKEGNVIAAINLLLGFGSKRAL